ncbi:hypothetical protein DTO164E3_1454 [Paecilomyces variotii]|nr:hypothetical protein DTO032I3_9084 [Paecilomyces variotii]KAJ9205476.1 hypothetical protein DTO164E3_1454 [Paecilomyces variotii]KAJ9245551.1 hypothetical protein DTO169E5_856 [Paecilomyces variotii]KAJ9248248.1 hypothetical protein DTO207G8_7550 [Paecilomyces variotii]KAJ9270613.1 hypothetical protein DTO212C5_3402 [Paecilomyces variotii]
MSTQGPSPLPPTTILSTKPISQSAAHDFLAAYLDRANTDPALQPNSVISERGPVSRTTSAAPNLILHNLKRVQAGLAGEVLGRDLTVAKLETEPQTEEPADGTTEGWVDKEKWQQADEEGGPADAYEAEENDQMDVQDSQEPAVDKEERKRKKKERRLAEKRAKAKGAEQEE